MRIDAEKLSELRQLASEVHPEGEDLLFFHTDEEIIEAFNGIGPESWPEALRSLIDRLHPSVILAALIHDIQWTYWNRGTKDHFLKTNAIFERNCKKTARHCYCVIDPRRWISLRRAKEFKALLDAFGFKHYKQAFQKRLENQKI